MAISVVMPALEMAQETGKLISWLKKEGESVSKGEPLLEIETDKAVMEVESPGEGILAAVKAQAGEEIAVGKTIAWIVRPGETPPADETSATSGRKTSAAVSPPPVAKTVTTQVSSVEIRISPKARRLAAESGVDFTQVRGSGPGGEILASDIVAVTKSTGSVAPAAFESSAIAKLMAERTTQSWTTVPHFFVVVEMDAGALNEARQKLAPAILKSRAIKLTHTDLLVALVARVLVKHPRMNASWAPEGVQGHADANISIAISVNDGVVAPVIHQASKASLEEIAAQRRDLTERARAGKLRPQDLAGGTFTISNLGMLGVDAFSAIITPPQAAILAVGRITDRVVPVAGLPAIRPMMTTTLSCDHRVVDGAKAADFLRELAQAMLNPETWLSRAV